MPNRPLKTIVYVDGFNLYYGVLRRSKYKWLDLWHLFGSSILNSELTELIELRYYTAPILGKMCDDPESVQRQRQYLQALRKLYPAKIAIIEGKMIATKPLKRLTTEPFDKVQVHHFEEKKTDVNLAVDMVCDALSDRCDQIVLCSNDSDLEPALTRIKQTKSGIRIGLISPVQNNNQRFISKDLITLADWHKFIKPQNLASSQLPSKIPNTSIQIPNAWK
jgi:uncharacterized LabA/DUF88 family protein